MFTKEQNQTISNHLLKHLSCIKDFIEDKEERIYLFDKIPYPEKLDDVNLKNYIENDWLILSSEANDEFRTYIYEEKDASAIWSFNTLVHNRTIKKYGMIYPDWETGECKEDIVTDIDIIHQYYDFWLKGATQRFGNKIFKFSECIEDYIIIHWAAEKKE